MENIVGRWALIIAVLTCMLVAVVVVATATGAANVSLDNVVKILLVNTPLVGDLFRDVFAQTWTASQEKIIVDVRLPRVLMGLLVGAALAVAGTTTQSIFKNPMADPYILGISSGAAFGAASVIVIGFVSQFLNMGIMMGAFIGAIVSSLLVFNIARVGSKVPVETLLLSGIAVSAMFSAVTSLLMYVAGSSLHQIVFWVMGALWSSSWSDVMILAPFVILGTGIIYAYSRDLNVLLLGDESAAHLGTDAGKLKIGMLVLSSVIAAAAVSVSGIIGFVGLIIPHIMRLIVGPDHRILIPASVLVGAMFLTMADTFSRIIIQPTELPVGIITAVIGAPFFIYLLMRKKRSAA